VEGRQNRVGENPAASCGAAFRTVEGLGRIVTHPHTLRGGRLNESGGDATGDGDVTLDLGLTTRSRFVGIKSRDVDRFLVPVAAGKARICWLNLIPGADIPHWANSRIVRMVKGFILIGDKVC